MKYEDIIDMEKVDEKVTHLVHIVNAINKEKKQEVRDILWNGYDSVLEGLVELIGTQWCESAKEVQG